MPDKFFYHLLPYFWSSDSKFDRSQFHVVGILLYQRVEYNCNAKILCQTNFFIIRSHIFGIMSPSLVKVDFMRLLYCHIKVWNTIVMRKYYINQNLVSFGAKLPEQWLPFWQKSISRGWYIAISPCGIQL